MTHGPHHAYSSYSSLGLAVSQPFLGRKYCFRTKWGGNNAFVPGMAKKRLDLTSYNRLAHAVAPKTSESMRWCDAIPKRRAPHHRCYNAFGVFRASPPQKIGIPHSSSRNEVRISPIAPYAGAGWCVLYGYRNRSADRRNEKITRVSAREFVIHRDLMC